MLLMLFHFVRLAIFLMQTMGNLFTCEISDSPSGLFGSVLVAYILNEH